jgi:hypothetical protein
MALIREGADVTYAVPAQLQVGWWISPNEAEAFLVIAEPEHEEWTDPVERRVHDGHHVAVAGLAQPLFFPYHDIAVVVIDPADVLDEVGVG